MNNYNDIWYTSSDGLQLYARDYKGSQPLDKNLPTVICIPGLTRNSADFHPLSQHLCANYRVIAVDLRGRGNSAYDPKPGNYQPTIYVDDIIQLINTLGLKNVVLVGTSLGGFVSLLVAASQPEFLRGIVINDFGPLIEASGLQRIKSYVGKLKQVTSWDEAVQQTKAINGREFPKLSNKQWQEFTHNLYRTNAQGLPELNYDPAIAIPFETTENADIALDLWPIFDSINDIPMLLIRGALSDLVSTTTAEEMQQRRPDLQYTEIPDCGHAPLLNEAIAFKAIESLLSHFKVGSIV